MKSYRPRFKCCVASRCFAMLRLFNLRNQSCNDYIIVMWFYFASREVERRSEATKLKAAQLRPRQNSVYSIFDKRSNELFQYVVNITSNINISILTKYIEQVPNQYFVCVVGPNSWAIQYKDSLYIQQLVTTERDVEVLYSTWHRRTCTHFIVCRYAAL